MKTTVTFIDDSAAQIETYSENQLLSRKTTKPISAMIWMKKSEKKWAWGHDNEGHERAEEIE